MFVIAPLVNAASREIQRVGLDNDVEVARKWLWTVWLAALFVIIVFGRKPFQSSVIESARRATIVVRNVVIA